MRLLLREATVGGEAAPVLSMDGSDAELEGIMYVPIGTEGYVLHSAFCFEVVRQTLMA